MLAHRGKDFLKNTFQRSYVALQMSWGVGKGATSI